MITLQSANDRTALVGVIGLGYVGLPLIQAFVHAGFRTLGFDIDRGKVDKLRQGQSYIGHISSDWIKTSIAEGKFEPTADMTRLGEPDAILICVPTPLTANREPDLSYIVSTARHIAKTLRPGQLIVLESTTYPGTTRDVVQPILQEQGLRADHDFYLAYSSEREDPGNARFSAVSIPKVVGGIGTQSRGIAAALYQQAVAQVVPVSSCEVAEASKILENTYRSVNIALVNELKVLFDRMGIDVWEVIDTAKTKPFGFQAFYPGPGLGGHCIPIDPFYLTWVARGYGLTTRFIELAGEINTSMPRFVVGKVAEALNSRSKAVRGSKIAILGIAYKKDVDDPRESPAFELMELLHAQGAELSYSDPHVPKLPRMRHYDMRELSSSPLTAEYLAEQDCTLIVTDHSAFDYEFIVRHCSLVVDTRNATAKVRAGREKIWRA